MDAIKILGNLIGKNAFGSSAGGNVLESILSGGKASARTRTTRSKSSQSSKSPDLMSVLLGGKTGKAAGGLAGLAALIPVILSASGSGSSTGGGLLGGLLGGGQGGVGATGGLGGLGGVLGSFLGGGGGDQAESAAGSASGNVAVPAGPPQQESEQMARLLIEAMCLAARADGYVDDQEKAAILEKMGALDPDERSFVEQLLASSVRAEDFASRVPEDMSRQVYAFSLMAVKLDSREEAQYFARLAQALGIAGDEANEIHRSLGQPVIFK